MWSALRSIPYGETRSYSALAKTIRQPNAVRAVCGSPLAGTRPDEIFNVDPYAEQCFQHFLRGPLSASLPRKFKISFGTTDADTLQQTNIQDIGITPVIKNGVQGFRVVGAGGDAGHS